MKKNKHIGSGFDEFLREEGMLAETEVAVVERVERSNHMTIDESRLPRRPAWRDSSQ